MQKIAIALTLVLGLCGPVAAKTLEERVRTAALATYVHGMTAEIAEREVGRAGVPALLALLADPAFPRRDNVVAFLTYLGDDSTSDALVAFLREPPAWVHLPIEDRSLLLTPHALGKMAARGHRRAHDALLGMTAHDGNGGVLASTAARSWQPATLRDELLESAIDALADAGTAAAATRLDEIASAQVVPAIDGKDLRAAARIARHRLRVGSIGGAPGIDREATSAAEFVGGATTGAAGAVDTQSSAHDTGLDYANHVSHTNPMSDDRLDRLMRKASKRVGRTHFAGDVACCVEFHRKGTTRWFGSPGDGLDVIDNETELAAVLDDPVARVKVVRAINYCGGPGTNIIGCAWMGRKGAAVVRLPKGKQEHVLWIHEYGHNVGLDHNTTSGEYIMHGTIYSNRAVTQAECNQYHAPAAASESKVVWIGACADTEGDGIVDNVDNCPLIVNIKQLDLNHNGVGDICELL